MRTVLLIWNSNQEHIQMLIDIINMESCSVTVISKIWKTDKPIYLRNSILEGVFFLGFFPSLDIMADFV